ncbi:MAG: winged helix-turn-helix domain-containing protein [Gemmatimonadaceae bacterium]|nr:winged helix-turn-helix domain-containing protein [Gemmatimonadaceae bacterium]
MVGATRESVSLVLARFTGDGLVERRGSTMIVAPAPRIAERIDLSAFADDMFVNEMSAQRAVS